MEYLVIALGTLVTMLGTFLAWRAKAGKRETTVVVNAPTKTLKRIETRHKAAHEAADEAYAEALADDEPMTSDELDTLEAKYDSWD